MFTQNKFEIENNKNLVNNTLHIITLAHLDLIKFEYRIKKPSFIE